MTGEPPPRPATVSYEGDGITVGYDAHPCLHAAERLHGMPDVFQVGRGPWITPRRTPAGDVADAVQRRPGGAPRCHRTDGMPDEVPEVPTHVCPHGDAVVQVRGDPEVAARGVPGRRPG
ncbi:(4Fe-4S)-binding protein [Streptomyces clavifer]|uniref:(4Fe-4S)-binding protein n=1 Tax=Streptomyces clavifer TaxID=68188 RepID=UPI003814A6D3